MSYYVEMPASFTIPCIIHEQALPGLSDFSKCKAANGNWGLRTMPIRLETVPIFAGDPIGFWDMCMKTKCPFGQLGGLLVMILVCCTTRVLKVQGLNLGTQGPKNFQN